MKLPITWLKDYLAIDAATLAAACTRWGLRPHKDPAHTLGTLFTFAGFNCDGVDGAGDDAVLELDVLANRPDGQCVLGLAREAAAFLKVPLKLPASEASESGEAASAVAKVRVDDPAVCPRYTARIIRGVKVGPSPAWLTQRLEAIGLTPRNNIVDITNFILFELNHPLHAFDLNKLAGRQIVVRRAKEKEPFKPLYGEIPPLTPETLVIADAEKPVAVGGVIGGAGSEVEDDTTDILLEAATFDPVAIRRTVRRLNVGEGRGTDSSYRFERGVDIAGIERASARAARLIVELAGGTLCKGLLDSNPHPSKLPEIALRHARLKAVYGVEVSEADVRGILAALGCEMLRETGAGWIVRPPSWRRHDLVREADLIEEIARLHGYNHVPVETAMSARIPPRSALEVAGDRLRGLLTALGYFEAVSDSLIDPKWPAPAVWTSEKPLALDKRSVLREDHSALRNSLLVSLLDAQRLNQDRRSGTVRLFECGKVFLPAAGQARPEERAVLGLVDETGFQPLADALRRIQDALELDDGHLKLSPADTAPEFLAPGSACRVVRVRETSDHERAEDPIGWLGIAGPALCGAFGLKRAPAIAEIDLSKLAEVASAPRRYRPLPSQPENARDVALVVDEDVAWQDIEAFAAGYAGKEPLRDRNELVRFLSVYRGKPVASGRKSVAFSVIYRLAERSLSDEEVNAAHGRFVDELLARFKGELRK